jgi:hypothetical protein
VLSKLYWLLHLIATWGIGLGLIVVAVLLTTLYGTVHWLHAALGIGIIVLGEIARAHRAEAVSAAVLADSAASSSHPPA